MQALTSGYPYTGLAHFLMQGEKIPSLLKTDFWSTGFQTPDNAGILVVMFIEDRQHIINSVWCT